MASADAAAGGGRSLPALLDDLQARAGRACVLRLGSACWVIPCCCVIASCHLPNPAGAPASSPQASAELQELCRLQLALLTSALQLSLQAVLTSSVAGSLSESMDEESLRQQASEGSLLAVQQLLRSLLCCWDDPLHPCRLLASPAVAPACRPRLLMLFQLGPFPAAAG